MTAGRPLSFFEYKDKEEKNKFIKQYKGGKDISGAKFALRIIDEVEFLYGKPFYQIDKELIISALNNIKSSTSVGKCFTILNKYAQYTNKSLGKNYFTSIAKPSEIKEYVTLYSNVNKLCTLDSLTTAFSSLDHFEREKAVACLLFEGLTNEDILNLQTQDLVKLNEGVIILKDRTFHGLYEITKGYVQKSLEIGSKMFDIHYPDNKYLFKRKKIEKINGIVPERKNQMIGDAIKILYTELKNLGIGFCKNSTELTNSGFFNYLNLLGTNNIDEIGIMDSHMIFVNENKDMPYHFKKQKGKEKVRELKLFNEYYNISNSNSYVKRIYINTADDGDELECRVKNNLGRRLIERGELGEKLVLQELRRIYKEHIIKKMRDIKGFDFHLITDKFQKCIEVKTVYSPTGTFYITANEIKIATELAKDYYLVLAVVKHKEIKLDQIIVIRNPINQLGLNKFNIEYEGNYMPEIYTIEPASYKIKLIDLAKVEYDNEL